MLNMNSNAPAKQVRIESLDCSPSMNKYKNMRTSSPIQSPKKSSKSTKTASIAHIHKLQPPKNDHDPNHVKFVQKHQKKSDLNINGRLKIALYNNSGLLTVHVIQARQLRQTSSERCDSYVRVTMLPDFEQRLKCQTSIIKDTNNPIYDEKFSFEFSAEDLNNRLLITMWQKCYFNCTDYLIGSFSFKIKHILKHSNICAWYYLLGDYQIGSKKHYKCKSQRVQPNCDPATTKQGQEAITDVNRDIIGLDRLRLELERNPDYGFGFTVTGYCPCIVGKVDPDKLAFQTGLRPGDYIVKIFDKNVSRATCESVVKLIKNCKTKLVIEINREKVKTNTVQYINNLYFSNDDKKSSYSKSSGKSIELPKQYMHMQSSATATMTTATTDSEFARYESEDEDVYQASGVEDYTNEIPYVDDDEEIDDDSDDEDDDGAQAANFAQFKYYQNIARTRAPLVVQEPNKFYNGMNPQFV